MKLCGVWRLGRPSACAEHHDERQEVVPGLDVVVITINTVAVDHSVPQKRLERTSPVGESRTQQVQMNVPY